MTVISHCLQTWKWQLRNVETESDSNLTNDKYNQSSKWKTNVQMTDYKEADDKMFKRHMTPYKNVRWQMHEWQFTAVQMADDKIWKMYDTDDK